MSNLSLVERAQLGHVDAIAALMNAALRSLGIRVRAALQDDCLHVLLEAAQPPAQRPCIEFIQQGMAQLQRAQARSAMVYGRVLGQTVPSWVQPIQFHHPGLPELALPQPELALSEGAIAMPATLQLATITIPAGRLGQDSELIALPTDDLARPAVSTSQLVHMPRRAARTKSHPWLLTTIKIALKNDRLFLALLLGVPLLVVGVGGYGLHRYVSGPISPPVQPTAPILPLSKPDDFEAALQRASAAGEMSRYARTQADWQHVEQEWQGAVSHMKAVPKDHPQKAIAQIKAREYQRNLDQWRHTKLAP